MITDLFGKRKGHGKHRHISRTSTKKLDAAGVK